MITTNPNTTGPRRGHAAAWCLPSFAIGTVITRTIAALVIGAGLLCLAVPASAKDVYSAGKWDKETIDLFARLPIQEGGRVKPLDTVANFKMLRINGMRTLNLHEKGTFEKTIARFTRAPLPKLSPMEWALDCMFFPEIAKDYKCFWIEDTEAITGIGAPTRAKRFGRYSYNELLPIRAKVFELAGAYSNIELKDRSAKQSQILNLANNINEFEMLAYFLEFARADLSIGDSALLARMFPETPNPTLGQVHAKGEQLRTSAQALFVLKDEAAKAGTPDKYKAEEDALLGFVDRVDNANFFAVRSMAMAMLPPVKAGDSEWLTPAMLLDPERMMSGADPRQAAEFEHLASLERLARLADNPLQFKQEAQAFSKFVVGSATERGEYAKVPMEVSFYRAKYFFYAQWLFVFSFVLIAISWLRMQSKGLRRLTWGAVTIPWALLVTGIVYRCIIRGRPPVSTLYETILFITAVLVFVALFIEFLNRRRIGISVAALLGWFGLFLANKYEMSDKQDTMPTLEAVLDTNFWLATHVTIINVGYAAGMLAAAVAHVYIFGKLVGFKKDQPAYYAEITRMVYGIMCFALVFSLIGTVLGGIWANYSWGRFWGWDPKENGALMIVLSCLATLHARMGGYVRHLGINMCAIATGCVVAFSWWGVNLLGVGLHSYGFTSGIWNSLVVFWSSQGLMLLFGVAIFFRERMGKKQKMLGKPATS